MMMVYVFMDWMKALRIADSATVSLGLQDEIRRSEESLYDHRLHGVLLVAQGMTCPEVAGLLGDAPRSVENWVRRFETEGLAGQAVTGAVRRISLAHNVLDFLIPTSFAILSNQMGCGNSHKFARSDDLRGFPVAREMLLVSCDQVIRTCCVSAFDEHIVVGIACHV
jgi:Homeodomain-like domain